jgi:tryptophan synthase beta chain
MSFSQACSGPTLPRDQIILVNLSGRGDKDMHTVAQRAGLNFG